MSFIDFDVLNESDIIFLAQHYLFHNPSPESEKKKWFPRKTDSWLLQNTKFSKYKFILCE